jgi:hypothetical protein
MQLEIATRKRKTQMLSSALVGSFFFNYDKSLLYHVEAQVAPTHYLVAAYEDLQPPTRKVWPVTRISGFTLYPNRESALMALGGGQ